MLSRRQLRIKVLQALYAFFQDDKHDLNTAERELFRGIEKSYDLYITLLQLLVELVWEEEKYLADKPKARMAQSKHDTPKHLLKDNLFLQALLANKELQDQVSKRKISWQVDRDMVNKIFHQIKKSPEYEVADVSEKKSWENDANFVLNLFQQFVVKYENVTQLLEEKNIYYAEGMAFILSMVVKSIKTAIRAQMPAFEIYPLYKDEEDDKAFVKGLFQDTISSKLITEKYIEEKSTNWDIDRLAIIDVIILKMAISEIVRFSSIPVKVSINEYIDLSKEYSTPKSSVFVNGVLDKIVQELKEQGKVVKVGRGLIE